MSRRYRVIVTVQGTGSLTGTVPDPVEIVYCRTDDKMSAATAMMSALDSEGSDIRFVKTLGVRVDIIEPEGPPWES